MGKWSTKMEEFEEALSALLKEKGQETARGCEIYLLLSISVSLAKIADALNHTDDCDHCIYKMEADDDGFDFDICPYSDRPCHNGFDCADCTIEAEEQAWLKEDDDE